MKFKCHSDSITLSVAGPADWNSLPIDIRTTSSTPAFKKKLKIFCFKLSDLQYTRLLEILYFIFSYLLLGWSAAVVSLYSHLRLHLHHIIVT